MHDRFDWLFLDVNSFFATVEQQAQPHLRGRPIAVVPVDADTTCCIAVSYEARAYGVRTGTRVREARALCRDLELVLARPRLYVEYHHRIAAAIERCVPIQQVMSCDEFAVRLMGREGEPEQALALAHRIKAELRCEGEALRCSIGLGPNRLLAKIACEMQKPDGLMALRRQELPACLYGLELSAIPGVGRRMQKRLRAAGVDSLQQLCALSRDSMSRIWGNVWGDRMWLWLRGHDFLEPPARTLQSVSRQHILAPSCRTPERSRAVALKLLHAAARKVRDNGLLAAGLYLHVGYYDHPACEIGAQFEPCNDLHTIQCHFGSLWRHVPQRTPADLTVGLTNLAPEPPPDLFSVPNLPGREGVSGRLMAAVDAVNGRFGLNTVYPGSIHDVREEAPTRISFGPPPPLKEFTDRADRQTAASLMGKSRKTHSVLR